MLRKIINSFTKKVSIILLIIIALTTIISCIIIGLQGGLLIGLISFIFLDGIFAIWVIIKDLIHGDMDHKTDVKERITFLNKTKNNPTIR